MAGSGYFKWLVGLVNAGKYEKLCKQMFDTEFKWDPRIELDGDRAENGKHLRLLYSHKTGRDCGIGGSPSNVLEVLVALAIDMENIMGEPGNDHPERWFDDMVGNLHLSGTSFGYDKDLVDEVLSKWMNREYHKNGFGGLFPLHKTRVDQRKATLWEQAGSYMSERC